MFSPHAWGWSVHNQILRVRGQVFPTCVGMVRPLLCRLSGSCCFPHMRGDGPESGTLTIRAGAFSPHAWGWSEIRDELAGKNDVFPTCVGMVRLSCTPLRIERRFPHMRGDGPRLELVLFRVRVFSPHAWGWSEHIIRACCTALVFPTCVGMVRQTVARDGCTGGFPHMRGDGPGSFIPASLNYPFSPHAWGWSALDASKKARLAVFPTCVGMVRYISEHWDELKRFPHMRGDGP